MCPSVQLSKKQIFEIIELFTSIVEQYSSKIQMLGISVKLKMSSIRKYKLQTDISGTKINCCFKRQMQVSNEKCSSKDVSTIFHFRIIFTVRPNPTFLS